MTNIALWLVFILAVLWVTSRVCRRLSDWSDRRVDLMVNAALGGERR